MTRRRFLNMKSVRLTKEMRLKILSRLLGHAFGKRESELQADDEAFGLAVYEDVYEPLVRRRMRSLPDGFMMKRGHLKAAFGGQQDQVAWKGLLPTASAHEYDRAKSYPADHPLSLKHDELEKRRGRLRAEKDGVRSQIRGVLESVTTLRQLAEVWPEASSFVQDFVESGPVAVTALALPIKSLNEQLGLPPGTASGGGGEGAALLKPASAKLVRKLRTSSLYGKFGPAGGADARET